MGFWPRFGRYNQKKVFCRYCPYALKTSSIYHISYIGGITQVLTLSHFIVEVKT